VIVTAERTRAPSSEAEQKAHALLRAWLLPGRPSSTIPRSDAGTRYRIRHGRMVNIDQLDSGGNKVCMWCVVPEDLAASDCMLAQKIALETFEAKVLAIANRSEGNVCRRLRTSRPIIATITVAVVAA
jgi:hypothetical protein